MEYIVTWEEIKQRVSKLDPSKKYYGIPRGGQYIAAMLNPVDTVNDCDIIIDDLIDSGSTRDRYKYTAKPFVGLFDKTTEPELRDKWLVFPWEMKNEPIEDNVRRIIQFIGEDVHREGLRDTPKRYAKFLKEFLEEKEFNFTTFDSEGMDQMIVQREIQFHSLCEHHLDHYANRLQNQERITQQIADRIENELDPLGVAVSLTAEHLCMSMRGIKKVGAKTTTQCLKGKFMTDEQTRSEFMRLI